VTVRSRLVGPLVALAGLGAVVAAVPTRWFGPVPDDSHVFDPPAFSALWIERAVVPSLTVVVGLLAVVGLFELFRRDRDSLARWHRVSAAAAVFGCLLVTVALAIAGFIARPASLGGALAALVGVLFGLVGGALAVAGLAGWGAGYLRDGRRRLGGALLGGSVGSALAMAVLWVLDPGVGGIPVALPTAAMLVAVGDDLHATD
jgi:hypothetical protein